MSEQEAFEAWWNTTGIDITNVDQTKTSARVIWQAATLAAYERCATIAEQSEPCGTCDYHNVPCEMGPIISQAIREQGRRSL